MAVFVQQVTGADTALAPVVRELLTRGRALERGVPRPDSLAEDFGRLGMRLSRNLRDADERSESRLKPGDEISILWGLDRVRGTVHEVYGPPRRRHVVVLLTPELSGVVAEPTTVSLPLEDVEPAKQAS